MNSASRNSPNTKRSSASMGTNSSGMGGPGLGTTTRAGDPRTGNLVVSLVPRGERRMTQQQFETAMRPALDQIPGISDEDRDLLKKVSERYVFRANDYYLRLIDWTDPKDPITNRLRPGSLSALGRFDPGGHTTQERRISSEIPPIGRIHDFNEQL